MDSTYPVWQPDLSSDCHLQRFMRSVAKFTADYGDEYDDLYRWSIDRPAEFWLAVARYTGIRFSTPPHIILQDADQLPGARWFVGAKLNFAEQLLRDADERPAIIYRDESGRRRELSRAELAVQVADLAAALRAAGIQAGDRVAAVLPNCPETVIALLAASSIGAVFSSCSPDFGIDAITDRFAQIEPRILFGCDTSSYNGKPRDCLAVLAELHASLPSLSRVIVVSADGNVSSDSPALAAIDDAVLWNDFLLPGSVPDYSQLPFDHPLLILFSSGTTGRPKCIVHGAGGTLLQHMKELVLHTNLSAGDRILYYTTCGWMMWNWLVSALGAKATIVLYDGAPMHPGPDALWRVVEEEDLHVFGTSPKFLTEFEKSGAGFLAERRFSSLRTVLSTGAPLDVSSYAFVSRVLGDRVQLSSISGGTDIVSCFALGNPLLPVWAGEIQCRGLGMAVEVYDDDGCRIEGKAGELICRQPFPSMPLGFWNDAGDVLYKRAYFERFPGVWTHGDRAEITGHGGLVIYGRSDATLNPGGVRIGTAEVCGPALTLEEVVDCIAVSQRWQGDTRIVLFVVLRPGLELGAELIQRIKSTIRNSSSPRHVPAVVVAVPEIPRTLSGKAVELAVRAVVHDENIDNLHAIANPEALEYFRNRPELG